MGKKIKWSLVYRVIVIAICIVGLLFSKYIDSTTILLLLIPFSIAITIALEFEKLDKK